MIDSLEQTPEVIDQLQRRALAGRDPANTQWQRDLSVSHERIGNVLVAQGDGAAAREAAAARRHWPRRRDGSRS